MNAPKLDPSNHPLAESPSLQPFDQHNRLLADQVHPANWTNPTPSGRYNLVVIGGGTAGLVTAAGAAGMGAKVALVERHLMGGDCLNVGCVPSKAMLAAAKTVAAVRNAESLGIHVDGYRVDFPAIMQRLREIRHRISPHDSADRFRELGVDVFLGRGHFADPDHVNVTDDDGRVTRLPFKKAVIATGSRAANLPVDGIDHVRPLTNETLFSLTQLPARLVVIGGGPIGCEIAQAFARFGSQVTQIERGDRILPREDSDAAELVRNSMARDGVHFVFKADIVRFENRGNEKVTVYRRDDMEKEIVADQILLAVGRSPSVDGLGLDRMGVDYDSRKGIIVNDRMQTTNSRIYAAGDVASKFKFTHAADFQARLVIANSLFAGRRRASSLVIPWCTYTSPELARVGYVPRAGSSEDLDGNAADVDTYTQKLDNIDRAMIDDRTDGFVRIHVRRGTDRIVGATIVADHAGDLIAEITMAMSHDLGLEKIANVIHPYPTLGEAVRKLGDQFNKTKLTPRVKRWLDRWLRFRR